MSYVESDASYVAYINIRGISTHDIHCVLYCSVS